MLDANPATAQVDLHLELIQHMGEVSQFRQQQDSLQRISFSLPLFPNDEDEQNEIIRWGLSSVLFFYSS